MDNLKNLLTDYDQNKVDIYLAYLEQLKVEPKSGGGLRNPWAKNISNDQWVNAFKKVYETGLTIDGDSVTLGYRKKLVVVYDYHAYKNKILLAHPETRFDFQLVYEGDEFSFKKESGHIIYSHTIAEPFKIKRNLIGAYGIMKNNKGEFIESINTDDIDKFKNTSEMKFIWDTWHDRMVLKSIIKRICAIHFKDLVKQIEDQDNEFNNPDNALIPAEVQEAIDNAKTTEELTELYKKYYAKSESKKAFLDLLGKKKKELLKPKK